MKKHDVEVIYRETRKADAAFATYWTFWVCVWFAVVVAAAWVVIKAIDLLF